MKILIHANYKDILPLLPFKIETVVTDPPYGVTKNKWDSSGEVDFISNILPYITNDCNIIVTATLLYASQLLCKYSDIFSHDLVWHKTVGSGQLNINRQPLRTHEHILIFRQAGSKYNRLKTEGDSYTISRNITTTQCYGGQAPHTITNEGRDIKTVLPIANPRIKKGHPTEKPLALYQQLCNMYHQEGYILDLFAGSGNVLDIEQENVIAIEISKEYYDKAVEKRKGRVKPDVSIPWLDGFNYTVFE
jgi:site-specific DNA-methyltransferase (adenine-specific)